RVEVMVFPSIYRSCCDTIKGEGAITLEGKLINNEEELKVIARSIKVLSTEIDGLHINIDSNGFTREALVKLLSKYPGKTPVYLHRAQGRIIQMDEKYWIDLSEPFWNKLSALCGRGSIWCGAEDKGFRDI
ncbi:MAG: hypothetical protein ACM3MK_02205, partial [Chitinophagales bacterium]